MELVTLPRNVADAIERMKSTGSTIFEIMQYASGNYHGRNYDADIVWSYVKEERSERLTIIMRALLDGYLVEATPQEKLREYYGRLKRDYAVARESGGSKGGISYAEFQREQLGVEITLDTLGVKIDGINA